MNNLAATARAVDALTMPQRYWPFASVPSVLQRR